MVSLCRDYRTLTPEQCATDKQESNNFVYQTALAMEDAEVMDVQEVCVSLKTQARKRNNIKRGYGS